MRITKMIIAVVAGTFLFITGCGKKADDTGINIVDLPADNLSTLDNQTGGGIQINRSYEDQQEPGSDTNKKMYSYEISEDYKSITVMFERKNTDDDKIIVEVDDEAKLEIVSNEFKAYSSSDDVADGVQVVVLNVKGTGEVRFKVTNEMTHEDRVRVVSRSFGLTVDDNNVVTGIDSDYSALTKKIQ